MSQAGTEQTKQDVPPNTVAGAISSLQPGKQLSTTAIERLLSTFNSGEYKILDPAYISSTSGAKTIRLKQGQSKLLAPINHKGKHWSLAVVDVSSRSIKHFDSLPNAPVLVESARRALANVSSRHEGDAVVEWSRFSFESRCAMQQMNEVECGVCVVLQAICVVAGVDYDGLQIHGDCFRPIFEVALQPNEQLQVTAPGQAVVEEFYGEGNLAVSTGNLADSVDLELARRQKWKLWAQGLAARGKVALGKAVAGIAVLDILETAVARIIDTLELAAAQTDTRAKIERSYTSAASMQEDLKQIYRPGDPIFQNLDRVMERLRQPNTEEMDKKTPAAEVKAAFAMLQKTQVEFKERKNKLHELISKIESTIAPTPRS